MALALLSADVYYHIKSVLFVGDDSYSKPWKLWFRKLSLFGPSFKMCLWCEVLSWLYYKM